MKGPRPESGQYYQICSLSGRFSLAGQDDDFSIRAMICEKFMLLMVIERFKNGDAGPVYRRFREKGRLMPEGLKYVDSWVEANFERCFQLMECDDLSLFQQWILEWNDLAEFEIIPVVSSKSAREAIEPKL